MGFHRRKRGRIRPVADEEVLRLDVRWLKRKGLLISGVSATIRWWHSDMVGGRELAAAAEVEVQGPRPDRPTRLTVGFEPADGVRVTRSAVAVAWTPVHLGGERPWLVCPGCARRALVLWAGSRFACRTCYRLAYPCQNEGRADRAFRKAMKMRGRLGVPPITELSVADVGPDFRLRRMRLGTFERLRARAIEAEKAWCVLERQRWGDVAGDYLPDSEP